MKVLIFILFFIVTTVIAGNIKPNINSRIISGSPASLGQFPWQVVLRKDEGDRLLCGGSIISPDWVLTAAHCTFELDSVLLGFGTVDLDSTYLSMTSNQLFIHPNYNPKNLNNDVSLIKLPNPLQFSKNINKIQLVDDNYTFSGQKAIIAGFGYTDDENLEFSDVLQYANVQIVDNQICENDFGSDIVKDSTLCAKGYDGTNQNICSGDSGGPLILSGPEYLQIGINSFVAVDSCTELFPSGYVRISYFLDYISNITGLKF